MAEAATVGRPFDQARDVRHGEIGAVAHPHHAEVGLEGGEGVVGDLGPGRRHPRDEGALAHVGEPDQGHVGHQGQFEPVPLLVALLPLLGEGRGPAAVAEEGGVALPAPPALAGQPAVARAGQVDQGRPVGLPGSGADGNRHLEVGATGPALLLAPAVTPVPTAAVGVVTEGEKGRLIGRGHQPHVPPAAAVAPVGATPVHVGLPPEGDRSGSPVTGLDVELCLVDKAGHGGGS